MPRSNVRSYGRPPYSVAVLHGGPGAPGYMAPVARKLSAEMGVIEPLQTRDTVEGQIDELLEQLHRHGDTPMTLIGSSWGAALALLTASRQTVTLQKLILIGSAVFDAVSSAQINKRRMESLDPEKRERLKAIELEMEVLGPGVPRSTAEEWASIMFEADTYDPLTRDLEVLEVQLEFNKQVWSEFVTLRDTRGYLSEKFSRITVPTVVIHGEYDPHPIDGIQPFLESCLGNVQFHVMPKCGHYPWIERHARDRFYELLRAEF